MKISLEWLRDHLDLQDVTTAELADQLTFAGVEVEEIQESVIHEKVVVAEVLEKASHPNADKLSVCQVDHGQGTSQIVCGASNFAVGDKVPLALPGARLGELKIKKGKLRGVVSEGMMCSGKELGIPSDVEGLLILDREEKAGTQLSELFPPDTILTIEVTPNRPDWLSHLGIARELAAITAKKLNKPPTVIHGDAETRTARDTEIKLDHDSACPFYSARLIKGVKIGPSPDWLQRRLEAVGLRPINNIVDTTNYVLLEMGQPLHAFDLANLQGGIHVRLAESGEGLVALDGEQYELSARDTVIADSAKAVAIAGVMGGEHSGVTETTKDILLESAYFDPPSIRATSRRLALSSDSSYRFERGVDPQQVLGASALATKLILELAGGQAEPAIASAGQPPQLVQDVEFDTNRCRRLLGADVSDEEIHDIFTRLGLEDLQPQDIKGPREGESTGWLWRTPTYRLDLQRPVDLIEEVARVYGLDRIPAKLSAPTALPSADDATYDLALRLKQRLVTLGFCETPTLSMVAQGQVADAATGGEREMVAIKNPLGSDYGMLRTSLLSGLAVNELSSGLLNVAARNANLGAPSARLFELGPIYTADGEETQLALLIAGQAEPVSWLANRPRSFDLYDLRGVIESLLPNVQLELDHVETSGLALAADLYVSLAGKRVLLGQFGLCQPAVSRRIGYDSVIVAELRLSVVEQATSKAGKFQPISPYPSITRDVAMEVDANVPCKTVENFFQSYKESLLESFSLFDVFADPTGAKLDATKKSLAYSLTYRAKDKTLKSEDADKAHAKLLAALTQKLGVSLR